MKVVIVIKTLVHSVGGAEKLAAQLASEMSKSGVDTHLLTFDKPDAAPFYALDPSVTHNTVSIANTSRKTGLFEYPGLLAGLRHEILSIKPDCVIAFMHSAFVPVQCALLNSGVKVVLSEHTVPAYYKSRKLEYALLYFFSMFASSITIVSESIRAMYPAVMRKKMKILPNMIDSDFMMADVAGINRKAKIILSVGRLNADKDHAILIDAYSLLSSDFPDWNLLIIGEGEERTALEEKINALGLKQRISLPGVAKDMNKIYKEAQLFVHPSRYENFGLVTAEAMSHALPVIGFADCPGTNELILHEANGELVKQRTPAALAATIRSLIISTEKRIAYGENGLRQAEILKPEKAVGQWVAYVRNVCCAHNQ